VASEGDRPQPRWREAFIVWQPPARSISFGAARRDIRDA
jgi:hypothetical protein